MPRQDSTPAVQIPTKASRPEVALGDTCILLYGPPGIGKTALCARFPDALFLATERGQSFQVARVMPITSWPDFKAAVTALGTKQGDSTRTVIVDTVDQLYHLALEYVCGQSRVSHVSDMAHGKGWHLLKLELNNWLFKLANLGKGAVFISHVAERNYTTTESELTKTGPAVARIGYEIINALSDFAFYYGYVQVRRKNKRTGKSRLRTVRGLQCRPSEDIEAKDRSKLFPPTLAMPDSDDEAYAKLEKTFREALAGRASK